MKRLEAVSADAVVVGLYAEEKRLPEGLARLDRAAGGRVKTALDAEKFKAKAGQVAHLHALGRHVVVAGLGPRAETTAEVLRRAASAAARRARDLGARTVAAEVLGDRLPARQRAQAVVEGALLGLYAFERYKKEKAERVVEELSVVEADARRARDVARPRPHQHAGEGPEPDGPRARRDGPGEGAEAPRPRLRPRRVWPDGDGRVPRRRRGERRAPEVHPPDVHAAG